MSLADDRDGADTQAAALLFAVSKHDMPRLEELLDSGVSPNAADYDRRTAAHIAASEGHLDILKRLKKAGADLNARDRWSGTPLDDAMMEGNQACIDFLKKNKAKTGKRKSLVNQDTAAPVEEEPRGMDPSSSLAKFLQAAASGSLSTMKKLTNVDVNSSDYDARTALHVAASEGQLEVVKYLVEKGALINARDRWGHTPLDDSLRGQFSDVSEFLKDHGGEVSGVYGSGNVSDDELKRLQERGEAEKWAILNSEIKLEAKPFARGAGGELYKARWRGLRVVAKSCANMISNKQALVDLGNEISLLSTLRHPNLVMFLGASFQEFPPLLLMEYCHGGTVEERLLHYASEGKALPKREKVKFTYELALALNFLHLCSPCVVHRDLKPSNILLTADLNLRVTDFGLSKFIPSKNKKMNDKFKMTGETGSYRFMAPEVFKHEQYNEKVDVYSFALIVYWMQTGVRPFVHLTDPVAAVRAAAVDGVRPKFGSNFDPKMKALLSDAWQQDPEMRPAFAEIVDRLDGMGYESFSLNNPGRCSLC